MRSIDERIGGMDEAIKAACGAAKASIRVAMPGIIQSYNRATQTATVQLAIREKVSRNDTVEDVEIPLLVDVPVVMPRAGGYVLVFAPERGDECLVIFSDLCIDSWWQSGGIQNQAEVRRHDFSDGFAVVGTWSQPRRLTNAPQSGVALQNDAGTVGVFIAEGIVDIRGDVRVNGLPLG